MRLFVWFSLVQVIHALINLPLLELLGSIKQDNVCVKCQGLNSSHLSQFQPHDIDYSAKANSSLIREHFRAGCLTSGKP
jgi:hypothetical protein